MLRGGSTREHTYHFRLPAYPPARLMWSVAIYSAFDAAGLDNGQRFPSLNSTDDLVRNEDGSVDFTFGPQVPDAAAAANHLGTVPGEGFVIIVRLYGTQRAYYEGTWKLPDIERIG